MLGLDTNVLVRLEARELGFEDEAAVGEALFNWQDSQSGFADCLIVAHNRQLGCRSTATRLGIRFERGPLCRSGIP